MPAISKVRYERFAQSYVGNFNARLAAISVGYKPSFATAKGRQLLQMPQIQARIEELNQELLAELGITNRYVLGKLKEMVEYGMEEKPFKGKNGKITVYRKDPRTAREALELLGKHLKMFQERPTTEITINSLAKAFNDLDEFDARNNKPAEPV